MLYPTLRLFDGYDRTSPQLRDEVMDLQELLNAAGYSVVIDGFFGRATEKVVKEFQLDRALDDDGIVGPLTWAALLEKEPPDLSELFETTYPRYDKSLLEQLEVAQNYKEFIEEGAKRYGLAISIVGAVGSRESHWGLILKPPGPGGTGDYGHGRGLMQIDDRAHGAFINSGKWTDPRENILYGCKVLADSHAFMERRTNLQGKELLRAALAGYNAGPGNALKAWRDRHDLDYFSANRNYSKDVLDRAGWFQLHGWIRSSNETTVDC